MSMFSCLPRVDYCCACLSLKLGSFLIAIFMLIGFIAFTLTSYFLSKCEGGTYNTVMEIATYVVIAVDVIMVIASLIFIFGIIKSIPETAIIFMYALLLNILVKLVFIVLAIVFSILDPNCPHYISIIAPIIFCILGLYFLVVVNSYEEKMLD